jgi:membrane associated rhomboid family serine protease
MNPIWIAGNTLGIISGLICMSYLIWVRRKLGKTAFPIFTLALIGLTATITALQFVYPALLPLFVRNPERLRSGELWRVITPMFVQPGGISQCIANAFLLIGFMPMVEKLYGKGLLAVFLGAGLLSQIFLNLWLPYSGGSSSAAFGLIGALFCYLLRERKQALLPFVVLPAVGLLAGAMLAFARDGHGAGMWFGAIIACALPATRFRFENA